MKNSKKDTPKKINSINASIVLEFDYHSYRNGVVGLHSKYGGKTNIDEVLSCPTCSGNDVKNCDSIGYIFCNVCRESYPSFEFYEDVKRREKAFLQTVTEIKSNVDNYALLQILDDDYRKRFYTHYISQSFSGNTPRFILYSTYYSDWLRRLDKDKEYDLLKDASFAKDNLRLTRILWVDFVKFLKLSAGSEAFNEDSTTQIPKADMIREMQRLTLENREMKQLLKDYGLN